jgi:hypothetical protein
MPYRLHPLWYTPVLPVLFFTSAVMTGLTMGALGYRAACAVMGQKMIRRVYDGLAHAAGWVAVCYLGIKAADWIARGQVPALFSFDYYSWLAWGEIALLVAPILVLASFAMGTPMTLLFHPFEIVAIGLSVVATTIVSLDGESNWVEGLQLLAIYLVVAAAFYLIPAAPGV